MYCTGREQHIDRIFFVCSVASFNLVGCSRAVANLSLGQIVLDPINFAVTSTLNGLGGLKGSSVIDSVDVMGGTSDHINLNINGMY
jgi:Protein of unknown function (DUF3712)